MGNLVNQYIAAQKPIIDNLQTSVDAVATEVYNLREKYNLLLVQQTDLQNKMTVQYNIVYREAAKIVKLMGHYTAEQYTAKILAGEKAAFAAPEAIAAAQKYVQLENSAKTLKGQIESTKLMLDQKTTQLNDLTKQLSEAGAVYQAGLIKAQSADDASATQAAQAEIDKQQAGNVEFTKVKTEADVQKAQIASAADVAKQVGEQNAKNNKILIIGVIAAIIVIGVVTVLIFKK